MSDVREPHGMTGASSTINAFFDERAHAQAAVDRLRDKAIPASAIRMTEGTVRGDRAEAGHAAHRGFFEALADFFIPNEDRYAYAEGLARGGYLVSVTGLSGSDYDLAIEVLDDEGAVDLGERAESWRAEGWTGYDPAAAAGMAAGTGAMDADALRIGKRDVSHGRARVRSYVVEDPASE
jgi:hypothetical protein